MLSPLHNGSSPVLREDFSPWQRLRTEVNKEAEFAFESFSAEPTAPKQVTKGLMCYLH